MAAAHALGGCDSHPDIHPGLAHSATPSSKFRQDRAPRDLWRAGISHRARLGEWLACSRRGACGGRDRLLLRRARRMAPTIHSTTVDGSPGLGGGYDGRGDRRDRGNRRRTPPGERVSESSLLATSVRSHQGGELRIAARRRAREARRLGAAPARDGRHRLPRPSRSRRRRAGVVRPEVRRATRPSSSPAPSGARASCSSRARSSRARRTVRNRELATGDVEVQGGRRCASSGPPTRPPSPSPLGKGETLAVGRAASPPSLSRSAAPGAPGEHRAAPPAHAGDAQVPERARLPRDRDADSHEAHARGRARLSGAEPRAARESSTRCRSRRSSTSSC